MDKPTRNLISNATQAARRLLEEELAQQLEGVYDVLPDGTFAESGGSHLGPTERLVRDKIAAVLAHKRAGGKSPAEAVDDYLREAAFTCLNRFVALKMLEVRELVRECVSRGDASSGFREFCGLASGLASLPDKGYRLFIESLFDELSTEIKVLFDRHDPASLLWPRRQALADLLDILNAPELVAVWGEDETIGWVYQYFNSGDERKKMREESQAPRNSRELAVRNQFFTPRYVVQFLTDNTLGRIWYEMRQGDTALVDRCAYLVRNQEGVAERPKKDPRDIRLLDPAGGSGHFLLYAFDLFLVIYEEAWNDQDGPRSKKTGRTLRADYSDLGSLRRALPALILNHNLHAVDIDPRCVQIAALALWMRAQRAYSDLGLPASERAPITRIHVVVAEPMPGDEAMVETFAASLEPPLLGTLFKKMVGEMRLAGELGTLLRVEDGIANEVTRAREQFVARDRLLRTGFLPGMEPPHRQGELDLSGIDDAEFFHQAEGRIVEALRHFAEAAVGGAGVRLQLFAGDAAQGIALIDIVQARYEVVLMNPPFGSPPSILENAKEFYPNSGRDIYGMFVERMSELRTEDGLIGAILPRTGLFIGTMSDLRREYYLRRTPLVALLDLGKDVLDSATVRTACYVLGTDTSAPVVCVRIGNIQDRIGRIHAVIRALQRSVSDKDLFVRQRQHFESLPASAIAYWIPETLAATLKLLKTIETVADIRQGIATGDNFRFLRLFTEIPPGHPGFSYYSKGGEPVPFVSSESLYVRSAGGCKEMKANAAQEYGSASRTIKNEDTFGRPGITYSQVNDAGLKFRIHPPESLYDMKGPVLFERDGTDRRVLLAFLNSSPVEDFMRMMTDGRQWHVTALKAVPMPHFDQITYSALARLCVDAAGVCQERASLDETGHAFCLGNGLWRDRNGRGSLESIEEEIDDTVWAAYGAARQDVVSMRRQRHLFLERAALGFENEDQSPDPMPSVALGCAFGRWDIRLAAGEESRSELPDPFAPLPVCPPSQLQNEKGLPVGKEEADRFSNEGQWDYPIEIAWNGVLVDDPGHPHDIEARVQKAFEIMGMGHPDASVLAVCEDSVADGLRAYFRRPNGFFSDHLRAYSKSRRKAPIYWQLATPSAGYSVWLYYHRLAKDTFFKVLSDYVVPKVEHEHAALIGLAELAGSSATASQRKEIAEQEAFVDELRSFRDEVARIAPLWNPDLDDGVIINFAPLWRLVPQHKVWQRECKECWDKLVAGEYDWAHLAMHLWPERVVPKCASDRSLAIAHGLEEVFWEEDESGKWQPRRVSQARVEELVQERTSPAVKAALQSLLDAPSVAPGRGPRAPRRQAVARPTLRPPRSVPEAAEVVRVARGPVASDETLRAVRDAIATSPGGASRADVMASTGVPPGEWNAAISALLERGEVVRSGEKRGTRYFVKGGLSA